MSLRLLWVVLRVELTPFSDFSSPDESALSSMVMPLIFAIDSPPVEILLCGYIVVFSVIIPAFGHDVVDHSRLHVVEILKPQADLECTVEE